MVHINNKLVRLTELITGKHYKTEGREKCSCWQCLQQKSLSITSSQLSCNPALGCSVALNWNTATVSAIIAWGRTMSHIRFPFVLFHCRIIKKYTCISLFLSGAQTKPFGLITASWLTDWPHKMSTEVVGGDLSMQGRPIKNDVLWIPTIEGCVDCEHSGVTPADDTKSPNVKLHLGL